MVLRCKYRTYSIRRQRRGSHQTTVAEDAYGLYCVRGYGRWSSSSTPLGWLPNRWAIPRLRYGLFSRHPYRILQGLQMVHISPYQAFQQLARGITRRQSKPVGCHQTLAQRNDNYSGSWGIIYDGELIGGLRRQVVVRARRVQLRKTDHMRQIAVWCSRPTEHRSAPKISFVKNHHRLWKLYREDHRLINYLVPIDHAFWESTRSRVYDRLQRYGVRF